MSRIFQILPEVAIVVAIVGVILFTVLAFRNPFRANWLRWNASAVAASLLVAVAVSFGIGVLVSGAVAAGFDAGSAILLSIAIAVGAGYAIARGVGMGERLRRCDEGQSPFHASAATDTLKRVWQRHPGKGAGA